MVNYRSKLRDIAGLFASFKSVSAFVNLVNCMLLLQPDVCKDGSRIVANVPHNYLPYQVPYLLYHALSTAIVSAGPHDNGVIGIKIVLNMACWQCQMMLLVESLFLCLQSHKHGLVS